jgi:tetratricopeptide (TPR) repeat protein
VDDRILLARIAARSGKPDAALEHVEEVLEFYPNSQRYRLSAGELAFAIGDYKRAVFHFEHLVDDKDTQDGINCLLADLYLHLDNTERALAYWESAKNNCPAIDQMLITIAWDLITNGSMAEAEELVKSLSQAHPQNPEHHLLLGMIAATYDPEKALASLRLADDLTDNSNTRAQHLFRVIEDARAADHVAYSLAIVGQYFAGIGEWMLSVRSLQTATSIQPDYADAYAYLGLARDQVGENGIVELLKAVELSPEEVIPHLYLGMHWQLKNEFDMAFNEFEKASEIDPTNPAIAAQIGAVYEAKGEINTAIQAYRTAAEMDPQDANFWLLLAHICLEHELHVADIALPAARNAVALEPNNPNALEALGYSYYLLEDFNFAESFILRSIQLNPESALSQYHLGLLKIIQNEPSNAFAAFKMAYELDPEGSIGIRAQRALETISP